MNGKARALKFIDLVLLTLPFAYCWWAYYGRRVYLEPFWNRGNYVVILVFTLFYLTCGRIYGAFQIGRSSASDLIFSHVLAAGAASVGMYVILCLLHRSFPNAVPLLGTFAADVLISIPWSAAADWIYFRSSPPRKTAIVYGSREGLEVLIGSYSRLFEIVGTYRVEDVVGDMGLIGGVDAVFLSGVPSMDRNTLLKYCAAERIEVYTVPRIGDVLMQGSEKIHLFPFPVYRIGNEEFPLSYRIVKRGADVVLSLAALIVSSPVMAVTALLIMREDHGPAIYRQERLTKDGEHFWIYKFRSMKVGAENATGPVLSTGSEDDRLTKVGRVIRRFRIDELPQFVNILRGDMSLVGPRPERPEIAAGYEEELPEFALRLQVRAGLTGRAQVYGRYSTEAYDKLLLDLEYIRCAGVGEDLKIMLATVKTLFLKESTE